jgi:predicted phage baseplate assembly protein
MLIPLPDLDDRRWADLVEESRSLIPVLAPEWTDHNTSDPGVTLIELFAWLAEMDIYRVNQVPDSARRRFLRLVGIVPRPPTPARTVVAVRLRDGVAAVRLPAGTELETTDPAGIVTRFGTLEDLTAVAGTLRALYSVAGRRSRELRSVGSDPLLPFGGDPTPGATLYLGFTRVLPVATPVSVHVSPAGTGTGPDARARLLLERIADPGCQPVDLPCDCPEGVVATPVTRAAPRDDAAPLRHHSVVLAWEVRALDGQWRRLGGDEVVDETRALTLDGRIVLRLASPMAPGADEDVDPSLYYVRCRLEAGAYDRAPAVTDLSLNAVAALQAVTPSIPPDRRAAMPDAPGATAERLGIGTGRPWQRLVTTDRQVVGDSLVVRTAEGGRTTTWEARSDFDASSRRDAHVVVDHGEGSMTFGDGEHGRAVPAGAPIVASYLVTTAEAGNIPAHRSFSLAQTPHNSVALAAALGGSPAASLEHTATTLDGAENTVPATGGATAETLDHAEGRAIEAMARVTRAVTLRDIEELACATPGASLARAAAIAGLHPAFPCVDAAGMVTVVVLPWLPAGRPMPSSGLLRAVHASLARRRLVGTRIEVTGPTYLEVAVRATVAALPGAARDAVRDSVLRAVGRFFDPLEGGPDGTGWPFGRDVYRTEVLDVVNRVVGVARVESLELVAEGCGVCSNVCVGRTGLVASGAHEIVVR